MALMVLDVETEIGSEYTNPVEQSGIVSFIVYLMLVELVDDNITL